MKSETFDSVWDALGFDPVEAANLKLRSDLMIEISKYVEVSGMTQTTAAEALGTTQSRLNDVLVGRIGKCSIDRLVNMLVSVGYQVEFTVSKLA